MGAVVERGPRASGARGRAVSIVGATAARAALVAVRARDAPADGGRERDGRDEVGEAVRAVEVDDRADAARTEHDGEVDGRLEQRDPRRSPRAHAANTPRRMPLRPSPMRLSVVRSRRVVSRVPGCSVVLARRPWLASSRAPSTAGSRPAGSGRACSTCRSHGLPAALDGLRIGHLSDFHLGAPLSRGNRASERAVDWVAERRPDLVCVTGDLVSHPRGERRLRELLARLERSVRRARQPRRRRHARPVLARRRAPRSRAGEAARATRPRRSTLRGERVSVVGVDPETYRASARGRTSSSTATRRFASCSATSRAIVDRIPPGVVRPHPRRAPARRSDLPAAPAAAASRSRTRARGSSSGLYETAAGDDARLAGDGHDVRPVPVLRPARGDGARPAAAGLDWLAWRATPSSRTTCSRRTRPTRRCEVEGVHELVDGPRRHHGVRVTEDGRRDRARAARRRSTGARCAPEVGAAVQRRVAEYLVRTAQAPVGRPSTSSSPASRRRPG